MTKRINGKRVRTFRGASVSLFVHGRTGESRQASTVEFPVYIELRGDADRSLTAVLSHDEARELLEAVEATLADAPKPITEPVGVTHVVDRDGDVWRRDPFDAMYRNGFEWRTFAEVVRAYGPVRVENRHVLVEELSA